MSTVGIVVEYNPLHNGHLYHIQQSKKITQAETVVAVMSGNFLQRGEPALADKWARTEMALRAGCDLVLELPAAYSSQPAQWFAYGAVSVLDASGVVDALCFGSESGELASLQVLASLLTEEPEAFAPLLAERLKAGQPYPSAFTSAAEAYLRERGMAEHAYSLSQPNHTLGLHYMIALRKLGSAIAPYTLRREKSGYAQTDITDAKIASATALRKLLLGEAGSLDRIADYVPASTLDILRRETEAGRAPIHWESFSRPLFHELLRQSASGLSEFAEVTEGLEHRIRGILPDLPEYSVSALLETLKTKRYTRTKLQRTLLRVLLGHRKELLNPERLAAGVAYIRVLGFTERGQSLLRDMRRRAKAPVVSSAAKHDSPYLAMDAQASGIYALAFRDAKPDDAFRDFTLPPVRLSDK